MLAASSDWQPNQLITVLDPFDEKKVLFALPTNNADEHIQWHIKTLIYIFTVGVPN